MTRLLILALLGGCAGTQIAPDTLNTTRTAWLEAGYDDPEPCPIKVVYLDSAGVSSKCRAPALGCSGGVGGCILRQGGVLSSRRYWLLVVHKDRPRTIWHELTHAYSVCSSGDIDAGHTGEQWGGYLKSIGGF